MEEAKNQLMLQATPTPLETTERSIHDQKLFTGTGFNGLTPSTGLPETPSTPSTPGLFKASPKTITTTDRSQIRSQLASLPTPQYEYSTPMPEEIEDEEAAVPEEMDAEEIERQIREEEEAMEREELERRSQVLKRDLPRGNPIPSRFIMNSADTVEGLLKEEINAIIRYEDFKYPSAESTSKYTEEITLPVLAHTDRLTAEMLIMEEAGDLESASDLKKEALDDLYWDYWREVTDDLVLNKENKTVEAFSSLNEVRVIRGG